MNIGLLFKVSAIVEVLTGLALLVAPLFVIGLLSVGVAGWESPGQDIRLAPRAGLCIYNVGDRVESGHQQ